MSRKAGGGDWSPMRKDFWAKKERGRERKHVVSIPEVVRVVDGRVMSRLVGFWAAN